MATKKRGAVIELETRHMSGETYLRAGAAGVGLYVALLMWSREYKTDGRIPKIMFNGWYLTGMGPLTRAKVLANVLKSGLVVADGDDYFIPSYAECAETTEDLAKLHQRGKKRSRASRLRPAIIQRDGLTCYLCGLDVEPRDVHVDHVHPLSRGGDSVAENLRVAHSRCNLQKGSS